MSEVVIGSGETKVYLWCVTRNPAGRAERLSARVTSPGLDAVREVYEYDGYDSLVGFFEVIAENWRGWAGEREYQSLEGDLRIVATHDGHVRLDVQLDQFCGPGVWTVRANAELDPGEDLANAARAVRSLANGN